MEEPKIRVEVEHGMLQLFVNDTLIFCINNAIISEEDDVRWVITKDGRHLGTIFKF